jgi:predicted transcriptional regulator of viral defense system
MKYAELQLLQSRLYFSPEDVAEALDTKPASAKVLCTRYAKRGIFIRLKRNFYLLAQRWQNMPQEDFMKIANLLQVPSYISFMSALSYYQVTTQVQRDFWESAAVKRSIKFDIKGVSFNFYKLKKQFYFDFVKQGDIFIATPEKALVDAIYLYSFGKYKFDISSLDLGKLDKKKIKRIIRVYPEKTKNIIMKMVN